MTSVQAALQFAPDCLIVPIGPKGNAVFKLDQFAPANGFAHDQAHDALADVEATIHMAKCVREREPECWRWFVRFFSKAVINAFVESESAFVLTDFYFNRPYHFVIAPLGADPDSPTAQLCLDLRHDLDWVAAMSDAQLAVWVGKSPKPVRNVRTNAAPSIALVDEVPQTSLGALDEAAIAAAADRLEQDAALRERLIAAVVASREEIEPSPHVHGPSLRHLSGVACVRRPAPALKDQTASCGEQFAFD